MTYSLYLFDFDYTLVNSEEGILKCFHMTPGTHFFPDTLAVLRTLRERGARIGIISTKTRSRIEEKFTATGTSDLIDRIIGVEDVQTPKPSPEGIEAALSAFGATKSETLYTGDSIVDAAAAQNAGVPFAAVLTGTTPAQAFAPYPHVGIATNLSGILEL